MKPFTIAKVHRKSNYFITDHTGARVFGRGFPLAYHAIQWIRTFKPKHYAAGAYEVSAAFTTLDPCVTDRKTLSTGESVQ